MKFKTGILLIIFCLGIISNAFGVSPQKRVFDGLLVESGTSTQDIMPLLANIAGRQQGYFKRKGYFKRIYGQYRGNYILIKIHSAGKIKDVEELETIINQVVRNVITGYPSSEGRLELIRSFSDFWDSSVVTFENGKVISKKISPSTEVMQERIQLREQGPVVKFGLSEEKRREAFNKREVIAEKVILESEEKYPNDIKKRVECEDMIWEKYTKALVEKYGITKEQLEEIFLESFYKDW